VSKGLITTLAMFGQYVFPAAFMLGSIISIIDSFRIRRLYGRVASSSEASFLNELTWENFERLVGEYYRRTGFTVSRVGGEGADGGVDLVLKKDNETHLVQCKKWKAYKVGVQPVREFYGVMVSRGAAGGYFVTSGEYTSEALSFARGLNLELVDGRKLKKMIDVARKSQNNTVVGSQVDPANVAPKCPKCGSAMQKKTARKGANAGREFWGCAEFPQCTGTRSV
jgi:restriction system protein